MNKYNNNTNLLEYLSLIINTYYLNNIWIIYYYMVETFQYRKQKNFPYIMFLLASMFKIK